MAVPAVAVEQLVEWEVAETQIGLWTDAWQRFRQHDMYDEVLRCWGVKVLGMCLVP